jgi:hypothetical protein
MHGGRDNDQQDPEEVQAGIGSRWASDRYHLRPIPSANDRVAEDMNTGDEFQDKMEDDLYKPKEGEQGTYSDLLGNICLTALALAFIFALIMGCSALWKAVF